MTSRKKHSPRSAKPALTCEELIRYGRQIAMPQFGRKGQERLHRARVAIVGMGGLGSPAAIYLATAGIGTLGLVDCDRVALSNLHRQVVHPDANVGRAKTESAAAVLSALNPRVTIRQHPERLSPENAADVLAPYDIVLDGSDNFPTRYLVNAACVLLGKPLVYGSVWRFEGQASVFAMRNGPCYSCLYPDPPPPDLAADCTEGGVLGVLPGIVGLIQATETIKLITGLGKPLVGRLLMYDALGMAFREVAILKDPACPVCGRNRRLKNTRDIRKMADALPAAGASEDEISPKALRAMLKKKGSIVLLDVRQPEEHEYCRIPNSILIPLNKLASRMRKLGRSATYVVYCRSGCRGDTAMRQLREAGFKRVKNLAGGILAWADKVDPSVPLY